MNGNMFVSSKVIELSETDSYIDLVDRVCYYDNPNLNGVQLDYDDSSLEKAETLINQPVLAHFKKDKDGKPTLGGHEISVKNGKVTFGTQAIGTHLDVKIEDAEVELVNGENATVKCLFSTIRLWKRFENCVAAAKRLFTEDKLHNSWEIMSTEYTYKDGIKHLVDYSFIGNCLLGTAYPAYGQASKVLTEASEFDENPELLIAEALSADLISCSSASNTNQLDDANRKEDHMEEMEKNAVDNSEVEVEEETAENIEVEEAEETQTEELGNSEFEASDGDSAEESTTDESKEQPEEVEESEKQENGSMDTVEDIYDMVYNAIRAYREDTGRYGWVYYIFPEEHIVWAKFDGSKSLQYTQFSYRIENGKAILENEQEIELVVSPLNINSEIQNKNNAIAEANTKIVELEKKVEDLSKAKAELDAIKAEQEKAERTEAINNLREYVENSNRFTKEELKSEKITSAIERLDEAWLKAEIADRLVASIAKDKKTDISEKSQTMNVVLSEEEKPATSDDVMRAFFND